MLKEKYGILLTLVLCASHISVYSIREEVNCCKMMTRWAVNCWKKATRTQTPPVAWYVKYMVDSPEVIVFLRNDTRIVFPNGLSDEQAFELRNVDNNYRQIREFEERHVQKSSG